MFLILTLGTPSLTYQLSQWAMISVSWAIVLKFMLASAGFLWIFCNGHFRWRLRKESAFFLAAALFSALLLRSKDFYFTGRSFVPDYSLRVGRFVGRSITPDAETRRFFATSDVQQYRYAVGDSDLAVLSVHCGDNIHEIHPAQPVEGGVGKALLPAAGFCRDGDRSPKGTDPDSRLGLVFRA